MRVEYINPFLTSTKNLFKTTFGIEPSVEKPFLLDSVNSKRWDISAEMIFTGNFNGALAIRMTRHLSNKLLEKSGIDYMDDIERGELLNAMVKELVNIIAGNASSELSSYNIDVSVPFIVQGAGHEIPWPRNVKTICIPFNTRYGPFVEIFCMKS